MLVGHAGDVENPRENAVKYNILLARTKNEREKITHPFFRDPFRQRAIHRVFNLWFKQAQAGGWRKNGKEGGSCLPSHFGPSCLLAFTVQHAETQCAHKVGPYFSLGAPIFSTEAPPRHNE